MKPRAFPYCLILVAWLGWGECPHERELREVFADRAASCREMLERGVCRCGPTPSGFWWPCSWCKGWPAATAAELEKTAEAAELKGKQVSRR